MSSTLGGRYRLVTLIGGGGMGEVWSAHDSVLDRVVAVKIIRQHLAEDEHVRERLRVEARLAGSLHHPGIVDVFDYGEDEVDGQPVPFIVMPMIDGAPLSEILRERGQLLTGETMAIVAEMAGALQAAHDAGIVHRDLKPANILLTTTGRVMLVDFGIARSIDGAPLTKTGSLIGTADYISPEQAAGHAATHSSDLYALGVVAFACVSGSPPFHRGSDVATALAHIQAPAPDLPEEVDTGVSDLVGRLLAKNPSDRPASAAEVESAARDFATTVPTPAVMPVAANQTLIATGTPTAIREVPTRRRRRNVMLTSAAVGLAAIVLALMLIRGGSQVTVPNVQNLTSTEAAASLKDAGLSMKSRRADVAGHRAGEVVSQGTSPGDKVDKGTVVSVTVATGYVKVPPDLVGLTYENAAALVSKLGLTPSRSNTTSTKPSGTVIALSPDSRARLGVTIVLSVATPPAAQTSGGSGGKGKKGHGKG